MSKSFCYLAASSLKTPPQIALFMLGLHLGIAWFTAERNQANRELQIRERLETSGAHVKMGGLFDAPQVGWSHDDEAEPWRVALGDLLGRRVTYVSVGVESDVKDLRPIGELKNLRTLFLSHDLGPDLGFMWLQRILSPAPERDLSQIANLRKLENLIIQDSPVRNVAAIENFASLKVLTIVDTSALRELPPLRKLKQLKSLSLYGTAIEDLSPLAGLDELEELRLENTNVRDVSTIAGLRSLRELRLDNTPIVEVAALAKLERLEILDLTSTSVKNVAPLVELKNLKGLILQGVKVDLSPLAAMKQLEYISINRSDYSQEMLDSLERALPRCQIGY